MNSKGVWVIPYENLSIIIQMSSVHHHPVAVPFRWILLRLSSDRLSKTVSVNAAERTAINPGSFFRMTAWRWVQKASASVGCFSFNGVKKCTTIEMFGTLSNWGSSRSESRALHPGLRMCIVSGPSSAKIAWGISILIDRVRSDDPGINPSRVWRMWLTAWSARCIFFNECVTPKCFKNLNDGRIRRSSSGDRSPTVKLSRLANAVPWYLSGEHQYPSANKSKRVLKSQGSRNEIVRNWRMSGYSKVSISTSNLRLPKVTSWRYRCLIFVPVRRSLGAMVKWASLRVWSWVESQSE